jgi:D-psicose/D-tagatose/L-ribulose 3-epimerase
VIDSTGFGLSTFVLASPFTDSDSDAFDRVARMGYDVIEVCIEDPQVLSAPWVEEQARRTGLAVSVCGAFGPSRDISSDDDAVRESARMYLERCVDFAAAVGSAHVAGPMYATTGVARLLPAEERDAQRRRAADGLRSVADYAAERGVRLAIEPLNRFETDLVNTLQQGVELCELIGRPNVGLMIDSFHMNIEEKRVGDAIRRAGSRVFHVQVSENDRGAPGSGHVPWSDFFSALSDIGYSGQIVVESFLPTVEEIARAVSLWRPVASSMDALAEDGLRFLQEQIPAYSTGSR